MVRWRRDREDAESARVLLMLSVEPEQEFRGPAAE
jgi:hypothetical protein